MTATRWTCSKCDASASLYAEPSEPPVHLGHPRFDKVYALDVETPLSTEDHR